MSTAKWPSKDPDEVLDYGVNWTAWLAGDTITTSTWIVPAGIIANSDSFTPADVTIWLSGGTAGESYTLTNRINTLGGRTKDKSVRLPVKDA